MAIGPAASATFRMPLMRSRLSPWVVISISIQSTNLSQSSGVVRGQAEGADMRVMPVDVEADS